MDRAHFLLFFFRCSSILISACIDFELAAQKAFTEVWPDSEIKYCLFHFGQSVWRTLQNRGLIQLYHDEPDFRTLARSLIALSIIPTHIVRHAFARIENRLHTNFPQSDGYTFILSRILSRKMHAYRICWIVQKDLYLSNARKSRISASFSYSDLEPV